MQLTKNTNSNPCNSKMGTASKMSRSEERLITKRRRKEWEINLKDIQRTRTCRAQRWVPTESLRMVLYAARPWLFRRLVEPMRRQLPRGPWIIGRESTIPRGAPDIPWAPLCSHSWRRIRTRLTKSECKATCSNSLILASQRILPKDTCIRTSWGTTPLTSQTSTTSTIQ